MEKNWTTRQLTKIFRTERWKIQRAEEKGLIPKGKKLNKSNTKYWGTQDVSQVGVWLSEFKEKEGETPIISYFFQKGGIYKSSLSGNTARLLALSFHQSKGKGKILCIGTDVQASLTDFLNKELEDIESLEELKEYPGLYEAYMEQQEQGKVDIKKYIQVSDLPNLHFIPENSRIPLLEGPLRGKPGSEKWLKKILEPIKDEYAAIIIDCAPNFGLVTVGALYASSTLVCPLGLDIEAYRSTVSNMTLINDFLKDTEKEYKSIICVPTMKENSRLSASIEAHYRQLYPGEVTVNSIRRAVKAQEARTKQISIFEEAPGTPVSDDYYEVIKEIWEKA